MEVKKNLSGQHPPQHQSPYTSLYPTAPGDVRWNRGFWANRFKILKENTIGEMWKAMNTPGNAASFDNFYKQAGLKKGTFEGADWGDGDCYKWMEARMIPYYAWANRGEAKMSVFLPAYRGSLK